MATKQSQQQLTPEELTIVDADSHLGETLEDLLPYMPADSGPRQMIENAGDISSQIYSKTRASPSFPNTRRGSTERPDAVLEHGGDPEGKQAMMDQFDIDYSIITPGPNIGLASVNHDQTAVAIANAYNSWLLDEWIGIDDRFFLTMLVANHRPDLAAEEIDRMAGKDDIVGVQMPAAGLVPPAGNWMYNPIYKAAEDNGIPVVMHTGNNTADRVFPVQRRWAETFTEDHAFSFPVEAIWHVISLVCNGIPERYPDLEFIFQEPSFEWVPWMMWRLDDHYLQNSEDLPMLRKQPSEYIQEQFYFTTQPLGHTENHRHIGWTMEMAGGSDTLLFSTDHPHADFDPPGEVLSPARTHLDADDVRGIMGETAIDVFALE